MRTEQKIEPERQTPAQKHTSMNGEADHSFVSEWNQSWRRRVKVGYPSIRRTRFGAFVIVEQTSTRTTFGPREALKALAFYQSRLTERLENETAR